MTKTTNLGRPLRILVIDDNPDFCALLEEMLKPLEAEVTTFTCPVTALQAFMRKQNFFDLVVLDYYIPHLNGEQIVHWLRRLEPQLKIVLCSSADKERLDRIIDAKHANGYVRKPFHSAELLHVITNTLAQ